MWRFEHDFHNILACQVWPFMNRRKMSFVHNSTLTPRMHQKLTEHGNVACKTTNSTTKCVVELKDKSSGCIPIKSWLQTFAFKFYKYKNQKLILHVGSMLNGLYQLNVELEFNLIMYQGNSSNLLRSTSLTSCRS